MQHTGHGRTGRCSRRTEAAALLGALLLAAGCSFAPAPDVPEPVTEIPERFLEEEVTGDYAPLEWWRDFEDPVLETVIDSTLVANLTLAEAVARVEQARAQSGIAWADLLPAVQAGAEANRTSQPANTGIGGAFSGLGGDSTQAAAFDRFEFTTYSASLGFSWELDFWGRARNDQRAAAADLLASAADLHAARLGVLSETISTYFLIADLRERVALTGEIVGVLEEREGLTQTRYDRGLTSSFELYQVRQDLRNAQAGLPQLETALADAEGRLAVLLGGYAGRIDGLLEGTAGATPVTTPIEAGIPADLLLQRPDVRAAAERLEAARYRVGARRAQLLPRLSISGSVGQQASDPGDVFDAGQWFTNLIGNLTAPLFQGGRLRNNVNLAEAGYEAAAAGFGRSVLTAVYEVEVALKRYHEERRRYAFLTSQLEEAQSSADLQSQRYSSGVTGYTDYLDALRQLLGVQSTVSAAGNELALARLGVYRALGGGWARTDEEEPEPSPDR